MWRILFILFFALSLRASTFYVATNGNNSADGSVGTPWLTVQYGATNASVAAGDTIVVDQGTYNETPILNKAGCSLANRLTLRGTNNPHINGFTVNAPGHTIDSFTITGYGISRYQSMINGAATAHWTWVLNNTFTNIPYELYCLNFTRGGVAPSQNASWLIVSNNTIHFPPNTNAYTAFNTYGGTNLFTHNMFMGTECAGEPDIFRVWGQGCIMSDNVVTNVGANSVKGGDFFQVFGFRSWFALYMGAAGADPVDGNTITISGNTLTWRNTVTSPGTEIQIATGYNNATNLVNHLADYPIADVHTEPMTTYDYGGTACRRVIIASTKSGQNLTASIVGDWDTYSEVQNFLENTCLNQIIERNRIYDSYYQICQVEAYHNDTNIFNGLIFRNNFFNGRQHGGFAMDNVKVYNNVFYKQAKSTYGHAFSFGDPTLGTAFGTEIKGNIFLECGTSPGNAGAGWYGLNLGYSTNWTLDADYNYVAGTSYAAKTAGADSDQKFGWNGNEANSINGGDLKVVNAAGGNFYPQTGSVLIDAGSNICTSDILGATRPLGVKSDIGAWEHDTNLLMWLDFKEDTTSKVQDITGNEHHAWQMDSTNWISTTNGPGTLTAGVWTYRFDMNNDPPNVYHASQYAAITNVNSLTNITNGTICFWVRWDTNYVGDQPEPERHDTILDAGYLYGYAPDATNTWAFKYGKPGVATPAGLTFKKWQETSYNDDTTTLAYWTDQTRSQYQWWHVAVTWVGGDNLTAYENGSPWSTNTAIMAGIPYFHAGGEVPAWICLGAEQHSGTPAWGDDTHPNNGWFKGEMADVRIYDRTLSASEITALYALGTGAGLVSGGNSEPASAASTTLRGVTAAGVTIR